MGAALGVEPSAGLSALSGMNSAAQLAENLSVANDAAPGSLSDRELDLIARVKDTYRKMLKVDCTACAYCMPCPVGVNIPSELFAL